MAQTVYILCALTSIVCAGLLLRQYRFSRARLLIWSTSCFVCFAATNILLFVDLVILPAIDLSVIRSALTLAGMLMLLYGLIQEST
jgi:hydrogenase/urease accessory protein HupE